MLLVEMAAIGEKTGGFECEFVESPSRAASQAKCSECLHVLREPCNVSCCGFIFCKICIERIQTGNNPCPTCNEQNFTVFSTNKGFQSWLYKFHVYCTHKQQGCEWTGELGQLDNHLNLNPDPENQLEGCQYSKVECIHCSELIQRHIITIHQVDLCTKRPFSCEYCHNYQSDYGDVIHNHWPVCGFHPVRCPNECGTFPQRQNLQTHITNECPLTVIDCDLCGGGGKLHRKDVQIRPKIGLHTVHLQCHPSVVTDRSKKGCVPSSTTCINPLHQPFIEYKDLDIKESLGSGSYGSVKVVHYRGREYAAKMFRTDVYSVDEKKVRAELTLLAFLEDENIVQYIGCSVHPDSQLPILLMERMKLDLHTFLSNPKKLHLCDPVAILHDVTKGLTYLHGHSPTVIHRDLTARNVLLDSCLHAKIADFGNSRIIRENPHSSLKNMTCNPGTPVYSAPEAFQSKYDEKVDIFSFGHLAIFAFLQKFPSELLPPTYYDKRMKRHLGRSEEERREQYFSVLCQDRRWDGHDKLKHSVIKMIKVCLHNEPEERPSAMELREKIQHFAGKVSSSDSIRMIPSTDQHDGSTSTNNGSNTDSTDSQPLSGIL